MMKRAILLLILLVLVAGQASAQIGGMLNKSQSSGKGDPRVSSLFDQTGVKYEVDGDGDFKVINELDDGRTQLVFIISKTNMVGHLEIREVWSVGYMPDGEMSKDALELLLYANDRMKLGFWRLVDFGENVAGVLCAQIAADIDARSMLQVIQTISDTADTMEEMLMEGDNL